MTEAHLYLMVFRPTKPCRVDSDLRVKALLKTAKRMGLKCTRLRLITADEIDAAAKTGPPESKMQNLAEKFNVIIESTKRCRVAPIYRLRRALKTLSRHDLRHVSCKTIPPDETAKAGRVAKPGSTS